ncbi:MAG: type III secretion system chaperone [Candidatus Competibacteraceae bacterium]
MGTQMGINQLTFNDEGLFSIGLDDFILNMELTTNGDTVTLTTWLAEIPEARRSEAAQQIADANYLFYGTQGATLGMNRSTGDVVLAVRMPTDTLTSERLSQAIENFMGIAENWQSRLQPKKRRLNHPALVPPSDCEPDQEARYAYFHRPIS